MAIKERQSMGTTTENQTTGQCPIDHSVFGGAKTREVVGENAGNPSHQDNAGIWHIHNYNSAKTILRGSSVRQAGFLADLISENMGGKMRPPVLYLEGKAHREQRAKTARFFTPKATKSNYRQLMVDYTDEILTDFTHRQEADLSKMSMKLAVKVAGQVIGLTDSIMRGMDKRLDNFFQDANGDFAWTWASISKFIKTQYAMSIFHWLDVKPAIRARKRNPQEDLISHLVESDYTDLEILTESVTFGAAGMVTTREFISVAAWHLLTQPDLMAHYLQSDETERHHLLEEILRIEPVVTNLMRRATEDMEILEDDTAVTIKTGDLIYLHIDDTNTDTSIVGEPAKAVCPAREIPKVPPSVLSFGDGNHRCPGSYIAIQESDIFLHRLLSMPNLRLKKEPTVTWNVVTQGYELRNFILELV
jgi:cytochrome P450